MRNMFWWKFASVQLWLIIEALQLTELFEAREMHALDVEKAIASLLLYVGLTAQLLDVNPMRPRFKISMLIAVAGATMLISNAICTHIGASDIGETLLILAPTASVVGALLGSVALFSCVWKRRA